MDVLITAKGFVRIIFYLKQDLSRLGRDLENVIILDNSPSSYMFHQKNAVEYIHYHRMCTKIHADVTSSGPNFVMV